MDKYQNEVQLVRARTEAISQAFQLAYRSHIETQKEVDQMLKHWSALYNYFENVLKEMKEQHETQSKEINNLPSIEDILKIVEQQKKKLQQNCASRSISSNSFKTNYLQNQYSSENLNVRHTHPEYDDPKIGGRGYREEFHAEPRPLMDLCIEMGDIDYNEFPNYKKRENVEPEDINPPMKNLSVMTTKVPGIEKPKTRINKKKTAKSTTNASKMLPQLMSISFTDVVEKVGIPKTIPDALIAAELMLDYVVQYAKWEKYIQDNVATSMLQNTIKLYPRVWSEALHVEEMELNLPLTEEDRKRMVIRVDERFQKDLQELLLPKATSLELPEHIVREGMKDDIDARCPILFEMNIHGRRRCVWKMFVKFVPELDQSIVSSLLIEGNKWQVQFEDDSPFNYSRGGFWAPTRIYCRKRGRLTMILGKNSILQRSGWRCSIFNKAAVILGRDHADMIRKIDYNKQKIHLWDEVAEQEIVKDFLYDPVARARLCSIFGKDMLDDIHLNMLETWTKVLDTKPTLLSQAEAKILCVEFWEENKRLRERMKEEVFEVCSESRSAAGEGVASSISDVT